MIILMLYFYFKSLKHNWWAGASVMLYTKRSAAVHLTVIPVNFITAIRNSLLQMYTHFF